MNGVRKKALPHKKPTLQVSDYVRAVEVGKRTYHLIPVDGKWVVKKALSSRATKLFAKKTLATIFARKIAKSDRTELFIHNRDGRIAVRETYSD